MSSPVVPVNQVTAKPLSLNEIRARVAKFVLDYKDVRGEKQSTSDFWKAFMRCYGVEDSYLHGVTFEYEARRSDTGGRGYIDVLMPGQYMIEQKSEGKISRPRGNEQSNAEQQARAYLTGGSLTPSQMPRYVLTSDFATIQITDLSMRRTAPQRTTTLATRDLVDHVETFLFLSGHDPAALIAEEQAEASIQAARLMGDLYAALTGDDDTDGTVVKDADDEDDDTMEASVLLTRLLFLMFGDDANLWQKGLFQQFIERRTARDGSDLGAQLTALFDVLNKPRNKRDRRTDAAMNAFPHVNGDLFHGRADVTFFDTSMRDALLAACRFDWSRISPAVFGSLFQTVKSKAARRGDGEHYTSEENILKTLRPMFLDDLRARLDAADSKPALRALQNELSTYRYIDPACGCGNFLIVAYREMRALELDLLRRLRTMSREDSDLLLDPSDMLKVRLDQFYGIELSWWPAKIAETAMFLVDHQANQAMTRVLGLAPERLPIEITARIHHDNALTLDWNEALPGPGHRLLVFGNPPFLGRAQTNETQKAELQQAWGIKGTGHLDFVTAWHAKALRYLADKDGQFAFVTTNSISQGEPVSELFPRIAAAGWHINFAHRTFAWNSETASKDKAAVHCVIVGFTRQPTKKRRLFEYPTPKSPPNETKVLKGINGYLVDGPETYAIKRAKPISGLPPVSFGSMPRDGGHLVVFADQYDEVMTDPVAARYVRRYVGGEELINARDRWCLWLVDLDPKDVAASPLLRRRLDAVRLERAASKADSTRGWATLPHLFVQQAQPDVPYLAIPRVFSEARPYATTARLPADVIASDQLFTCPDPDGFAFAAISSSMFITWQRTVGGRLESRLRFSKDVVWNNFPVPSVDEKTYAAICEAGEGISTARSLHPDKSLAGHYHPLAMDPELVKAHRALDRVVDRAFGAGRAVLKEPDRERILFERYAEIAP